MSSFFRAMSFADLTALDIMMNAEREYMDTSRMESYGADHEAFAAQDQEWSALAVPVKQEIARRISHFRKQLAK